jgi:hypothetical protein
VIKPHKLPLQSAPHELPTGLPLRDWKEPEPGEVVEVRREYGPLSRAQVDTLNAEGTVIWLRSEGIGLRTLHLATDPLTLYKH